MKTKIATALAGSAFLLSLALPVFADTNTTTTTTAPPVDVACVQNAIEKSDTALIAAVDAYAISVKAAIVARKDAEKAAWALTEKKARREALRTAGRDFRMTMKTARTALHQAREAAWKGYKTDRTTCHVRGSDGESERSGDAQI